MRCDQKEQNSSKANTIHTTITSTKLPTRTRTSGSMTLKLTTNSNSPIYHKRSLHTQC